MANYSKLLSLIGGADRTVDFSLVSNILELGGGGLQMNGSTSGHLVISASAITSTYSLVWPAAQAASPGYLLTNDGTGVLSWSAPAATGVTSVALTLPASVFSVAGSPVTSTGTLAGSFVVQSPNTVFSGPASGGSATPTFRGLVSADIPNNAANTTGTASNVTGIVALINGGTGVAAGSANAAFNALSPLTTAGDIIYENATPVAARLPIGSTGQVLTVVGGLPAWASPATSGTVTSVAFADGSATPIYAVSGSPVTSSGTLEITLDTQVANSVFAGPATGADDQPTFRGLVSADIPNNAANTTGTASNITATSNATITTLSALTTASALASVGTITSGTWNATTIAINHGGTGQTTAAAAYNALSPMTTTGDLEYEVSAGTAARLPIGSTGQILTVVGGVPAWAANSVSPSAIALTQNHILVGNASNLAADVAMSGEASIVASGAVTLNNAAVIAKVLTGYVSGAGTVSAADSILSAIQKINGNDALKLPLAGGTMTGAINLGGFVPTNSSTPVNPNDLVNKSYVDNFINATSWKTAALVATTANITLSGEQTIDGVLTSASRVLVKNQSVGADNGIYVSAAGAWARSSDMNSWAQVPAAAVFVESGTVNADLGFVCTAQPGGTLGSSSITWVQFSSAGAYSADNVTLQLISGVFSIKNAGVTETQIASSAISTTGALNGGSGTKLSVRVDNSTLDINGSNNVEVKAAGISATQLATGAFDQVTITGGAGTPAAVASSPAIKETMIAGESFAATTLWAVRFAKAADSGFVAGRVYKADNDTTSADNFYVVGLAYSAGSVSAAGSIVVTKMGLINAPSHGFTPGLPLYLGASGAITATAPSTSLLAVERVGMVRDANNIEVQIAQIGVN